MSEVEKLINGLPDPDAARRFYSDLSERYHQTTRLNEALLSDLLTISAYSPLLSTTLLQNPDYIQWLGRERTDTKVRSKEALLESLSRFSLLHSEIGANVMLARFRRRELLRIFLRDIRRLASIAEITEELSNLADAVIEFALRLAEQELQNRFGVPLYSDPRGRSTPSEFCVVALGKLGSRELNYSSDIDLLFIYSEDGMTSDTGTDGRLTDREYFIKLAEKIIAIAGGQSGEGAAYRIDMRLRPHGSIGRLALSLDETVRYYETEAREWEQQVLIRSRPIAGHHAVFKRFYSRVEGFIFQPETDAEKCLANIRLSRRRNEDPIPPGPGYNVKLGRGGIREIEFIAQALQLAHGGRDNWLRYPHTLVSLARLADRHYLDDSQLTTLFDAYDFLRRTEHLLQMEHGLQTHTIPRHDHSLLARRAGFSNVSGFDSELSRHTESVQKVFESVFSPSEVAEAKATAQTDEACTSQTPTKLQIDHARIAEVSPHFAQMFAAIPDAARDLPASFDSILMASIAADDLGSRLSNLRKAWGRSLMSIVLSEIDDELSIFESKKLQTQLAEASVNAALAVMQAEISSRFGISSLPLNVLALGKLGGRGVDYGSDLDIVLVYPDQADTGRYSAAEVYSRAVDLFVTTVSGMTRDGSLYRVDLRLRPYGTNGASSNPRSVFVDYFRHTAALWEMLAFVKLRGVAGEKAVSIEDEVRAIIHERARCISVGELASEVVRIRHLLERQKAGRDPEADIKYGPGGLLDVYFATRYLQLRDNRPDRPDDRSTIATLEMLWENGSLSRSAYENFSAAYAFLSGLDHNIRLTSGRSRRLPASLDARGSIAIRMNLAGVDELMRAIALHRLNIRSSFESVVK